MRNLSPKHSSGRISHQDATVGAHAGRVQQARDFLGFLFFPGPRRIALENDRNARAFSAHPGLAVRRGLLEATWRFAPILAHSLAATLIVTAAIPSLVVWPSQLWAQADGGSEFAGTADPPGSKGRADTAEPAEWPTQAWNWHFQNTETVEGYPSFPAKYTGANSLPPGGQIRETVSADVYAGARLWRGAEVHFDGLMWQGFGLHDTLGIDDFPNGEAYKAGAKFPNLSIAQLFVQQTFGLGGAWQAVPDSELTLAGERDVSRVTITAGRLAATNIFDNNAYANDPRTQFLNWGLVNNAAWDYPADSIGFTTGMTIELNQPKWSLRYGIFQIPLQANGWTAEDEIFTWLNKSGGATGDGRVWQAWAMPIEFERRYRVKDHPGTIRLLGFLNRGDMGNYQAALSVPGVDISQTRKYRCNFGFGLNWEQELQKDIGVFSRLGWNQGHTQAWMFTDVNYTASLGLSVKGERWRRPDDTFGLGGVISGISHQNQQYLEAGGMGILDGDGALDYGLEKVVETYYDCEIWKGVHVTMDYQFVDNPAFNRARGPVSILTTRLHMEL